MAGYVKTLYKIKLKRTTGYRGGKVEELIFEMRSIKTAEAFERILKRAKLPFEKPDPTLPRPRNEQGWRSKYR